MFFALSVLIGCIAIALMYFLTFSSDEENEKEIAVDSDSKLFSFYNEADIFNIIQEMLFF